MSQSQPSRSILQRKPDAFGSYRSLRNWVQDHFEFVVMAAAFSAMTIAYVIVFQIAREEPLSTSLSAGVRNIGAVLPIAALVRYCIRGPLHGRSWPMKVLAHIALACFVSLAWYTLVLFLRYWSLDWMQSGIALTPFSNKASFWHLYQGLVVYAALVATNYAFQLRDEVQAFREKTAGRIPCATPSLGVLFVKSEDELVRLEHQDIQFVSASNDAVTLHTKHKAFQTNMTMKKLEARLEAFGFVRIHRSYLINTAFIRSAEPTGDGRLSIHMLNNMSLVSSRAGAKKFKQAVSV
ncbi:MAG: LytTR family DNA-binding domain-containing protein [Pseudomonadota bacterium]